MQTALLDCVRAQQQSVKLEAEAATMALYGMEAEKEAERLGEEGKCKEEVAARELSKRWRMKSAEVWNLAGSSKNCPTLRIWLSLGEFANACA